MKSHRILSLLAAGVLAAVAGAFAANPITDDLKQGGFAIGPQAYSFNRFSAFEAIEKARLPARSASSFTRDRNSARRSPTRSCTTP
jgi:hypothetical protein